MVQEESRKGPWTEQEDFQLVCFVGLFGDRRWDFIAKVSGLNRTGKSCRLRWVNYLHPGLKRGKMTPQEEKLVLELHTKWGNRWSRIARRLPGRTDNEIKNYWRTYMRKQAQDRKRDASRSASTSNTSSSESSNPTSDSLPSAEGEEESLYDEDGPQMIDSSTQMSDEQEKGESCYSMDDIWKEIAEEDEIAPVHDSYREKSCNFSCHPLASPSWDCSLDSFWHIDEVHKKMNSQVFPSYDMGGSLFLNN